MAKDILGSDSEIDEDLSCGKKDNLVSSLSRRVANGVSKQYNHDTKGSYFIDLKLYLCSDIENVTPMNRWRQAIVTVKTRADENDPDHRYLVKFLKEVKKRFKECPVSYYASNSNQ